MDRPQTQWLPPAALRARPRSRARAAAAALVVQALRHADLLRLPRGAEVGQGAAPAPAQGEAADHVGLDARLRRRLHADLGLEVRGRVRRAAVRARDGALHPAAPRGRQALGHGLHPVPRRCGRHSLAGRQRARRGARRPRRADPRLARHGRAAPDRGGDRRRLLARARVHGLLPEPVQPAPGRTARRRPRDGGDGAVDVVRRLRRDRAAGVHLAEPDRDPDRAARRLRDLPPLEAAQARARRAMPTTTASSRRTGCWWPASTSA